jgi:hypothetical protein
MNETTNHYQRLAVFVAVAKQASFTKASRKLGIGKASVSRAFKPRLLQVELAISSRSTTS